MSQYAVSISTYEIIAIMLIQINIVLTFYSVSETWFGASVSEYNEKPELQNSSRKLKKNLKTELDIQK